MDYGLIDKDNYKFVVSGDSISKGVVFDDEKGKYLLLEESYVNLLQSKLKGIVCNVAKFGNTIIKGVSKLQNEVSKSNPDIVLIEYGGNDCDFNWDEIARDPGAYHEPKTDFNLFQKTLTDIVESLKKNRIIPVLMTLPPLDADKYFKWISKNSPQAAESILKWLGSVTKIYWWQERYNSAIMRIAQETQTIWIDVRGAFLQNPDFPKLLCTDGIHPNREGHKVIADKITEFLKHNYSFLLKDTAIRDLGRA